MAEMYKPAYKLTLGTTVVDSGQQQFPAPLVRIDLELDMGPAAPFLEAVIARQEGFSLAAQDPVKLELGYKDSGVEKVFEGAVDSLVETHEGIGVKALGTAACLLDLRIFQSYEKQSAGKIVKDLVRTGGLSPGEIDEGLEFPYYVVDDSRNVFEQIRILADRCGFDLYQDADNKIFFKEFSKTSGDHTFEYGVHILSLDIGSSLPAFGSVQVWGESPASSEGEDAAFWLTQTPADFMGEAGSDEPLYLVKDRSIRTKAAADQSAAGILALAERKAVRGTLRILGYSSVLPGDTVTVKSAPWESMNSTYQVRRVYHHLSREQGFITSLGLIGI